MDAMYNPVKPENLSVPTGRSLFLQNLRPDTEYPELYRRFHEYGTVVSCRVLHDAKRGASRGIGYVNFESAADAAKALAGCGDLESLSLSPDAPLSLKLADNDPNFSEDDARCLSVHFIPCDTSRDTVLSVFAKFGAVVCCELTTASASRQNVPKSASHEQLASPSLTARVDFTDAATATRAAAFLHSTTPFGGAVRLYIKPAENENKLRAREVRRKADRDRKRSAFPPPKSAMPTQIHPQQVMFDAQLPQPMAQPIVYHQPTQMQPVLLPNGQVAYLPVGATAVAGTMPLMPVMQAPSHVAQPANTFAMPMSMPFGNVVPADFAPQ